LIICIAQLSCANLRASPAIVSRDCTGYRLPLRTKKRGVIKPRQMKNSGEYSRRINSRLHRQIPPLRTEENQSPVNKFAATQACVRLRELKKKR
jgi:hypothetical protein